MNIIVMITCDGLLAKKIVLLLSWHIYYASLIKCVQSYIWTHACIYVHTSTYAHLYTLPYTHTHTDTCTYTHTHIHVLYHSFSPTPTYTPAYICTDTPAYICNHTTAYICTNINRLCTVSRWTGESVKKKLKKRWQHGTSLHYNILR